MSHTSNAPTETEHANIINTINSEVEVDALGYYTIFIQYVFWQEIGFHGPYIHSTTDKCAGVIVLVEWCLHILLFFFFLLLFLGSYETIKNDYQMKYDAILPILRQDYYYYC